MPALHWTQTDEPDKDHVPALQVKHVAADVAVGVDDHSPAGQDTQPDDPVEDQVPATHARHEDALLEE